jgi:hypothetical protein
LNNFVCRASFFRQFLSFCLIISFLAVLCAPQWNFAQKAGLPGEAAAAQNPFQKFAAFNFPRQSLLDAVPPNVHFLNSRQYARVSNQITVRVQASDDVGVSRVELYLDNALLAVNSVFPNLPSVVVSFNWNTAEALNGKHFLQAKAFDAAGNSQTAVWIVLIRNTSVSPPLPTAIFTATPSTISSGQSVILSWATTDAVSVTINQGIGAVAPSGFLTVTPTATTIYTLTATNPTGSAVRDAAVTVTTTPTGSNIIVSPAINYQTIDGWEATAEAGQLYSPAWNNYKDALFDQAVNDLGINRVRAEIFSGTENAIDYYALWRSGQISEAQYNAGRYEIVNDNNDPNTINPNGFKWSQLDALMQSLVLPLRQRLQARGETLSLNINYVDFGSSSFEHKNSPAEYGEFVLATYQHMQSRYGFVPDTWEVILEPDAASWTATQVGQAIKAAGDRLTAAGFTPRFVAPSTTNAANAPVYIDQIAQTAGAMPYVSEFSYHRYCCATETVLRNILNRASTHGKKTAMLEWIGADYETLHEDLKLARNSSWQQYTLAGPLIWGPDDGSRYYLIDDSNAANPQIIMGSRTRFLRQYFRFVRGGARRIEASSADANFDPLAFINPNGKYVVVVKAAAGGAFNIQGLPAGTYGIKYTTASQYNIDLNDVTLKSGQPLNANIPAAGVITIHAR